MRLLAIYTPNGTLVGLAPLRVTERGMGPVRPLRRLSYITGDNGAVDGILSEYHGALLRRSWEQPAASALASATLGRADWHDALFDLTLETDPFLTELVRQRQPRVAARIDAVGDTYRVRTETSFDDYKARLSRSTRRRLFDLRDRLERKYGAIELQNATSADVDGYLAELNVLHARRWGRPVFRNAGLSFISSVCKMFAERGDLDLSRIVVAGATRSVMLNLRAGDQACNLQMGFDETFDKRLPLGYLHLGFSVERYFADARVTTFDMLFGRGKRTDYKSAIATERRPLHALHLVRHPLLRFAHEFRRVLRWQWS